MDNNELLSILEKALVVYKEELNHDKFDGLCFLIFTVLCDNKELKQKLVSIIIYLYEIAKTFDNINNFSENVSEKSSYIFYWFPQNDRESRIKVLEIAINQLKQIV